ncbi:MAG: hypothetical protein ACR2GD_10375 [Pyrinomonadaceae bacterium]
MRMNCVLSAKAARIKIKKSTFSYKLFTFVLLNLLLFSSPAILISQTKTVGILNIYRENAHSDQTGKVNGNEGIDQQTIASPSVLETPFDGTNLLISLGKIGQIKLGPDTKMNLSFNENGINGSLLRGSLMVVGSPNTALNIRTKDGIITFVNPRQENSVIINFEKGKTEVRTLSGLAALNGNSIATGQYFITGESTVEDIDSSLEFPFFKHLVVLIMLAVLTGENTDDSNIGNQQTLIGPMK